ncbi:MAG: hypothetical protein J5714_04115 [Alphaproteobacteria bacterium]|nr:hypothetical protein [Alphaproteobacteria bacterium]
MKNESGRSLIEIIGVLAITAVMTAGAVAIYNSVRTNQKNTIAAATLREVAKDINMLMGMRSDYTGISVDYLVKAGALPNADAPIGKSWTIDVGIDRITFTINLYGLTRAECEFFGAAMPAWASEMYINGYRAEEIVNCFPGSENNISFVGM